MSRQGVCDCEQCQQLRDASAWPPKLARRGVRRNCAIHGHSWETHKDMTYCARCGQPIPDAGA